MLPRGWRQQPHLAAVRRDHLGLGVESFGYKLDHRTRPI